MTMKSLARFCYRCDAITPSECKCRKNAYCVGCQTLYQPPETCKCSHFVRERQTDIVGTDEMLVPATGISSMVGVSAAVRRNEEENRRTWNAAIEAVAKHLDEMGEEERISIYVREMKK